MRKKYNVENFEIYILVASLGLAFNGLKPVDGRMMATTWDCCPEGYKLNVYDTSEGRRNFCTKLNPTFEDRENNRAFIPPKTCRLEY